MSGVVIPDSITPVEGWKVFGVRNRLLVSPQQGTVWEPGRAHRAECRRSPAPYFSWVPQSKYPDRPCLMEQRRQQTLEYGPYSPMLTTTFSVTIPPPPMTQLPPGDCWILTMLDKVDHQPPHEGCSCGIHIAREVITTMGYTYGLYDEFAMVRVKGWGKVIPGTNAFRAELAYPSAIYFNPAGEARQDLLQYGVPVAPLQRCPALGPAHVKHLTTPPSSPFTWVPPPQSRPLQRTSTRILPVMFGTMAVVYAVLAVVTRSPLEGVLAGGMAIFALLMHGP